MAEQIEQKQSYLRQQIMGNDYDPEEFAEFCEQTVGDVDIQVWTLHQLKNIVRQFLDKKKEVRNQLEESSFMKYQQEIEGEEELDLDEIDVHRGWKKEVGSGEGKKMELKHSLSMGEKPVNQEESSIWGPESKATVEIESVDQYDINTRSTNIGKRKESDASDGFGDFSVPLESNTLTEYPKEAIVIKQQPPKTEQKSNFPLKVTVPAQSPPKAKNTFVSSIPKTETPNFNYTTHKSLVVLSQPSNLKQTAFSKLNLNTKLSNFKLTKSSFSENIPCIKAKVRTLLSQPSLSVQVTGHQIINRSFVLPSHVLYTLSIKPLNVEIKRKYSYFLKLRQVLSKFYPGIRLPYLQKGAWLSETGAQQIKMQKLIIQGFMNDLLMNQQLRNCRILQQFLTITNNNILKQKFLEYGKMNNLKSIEQMCLLKGSVNVSYSDQHQLYFQKFSPFLQSIESGIQKYKNLIERLSTLYQQLINVYTDLEEVFVNIDNSANAFKTQVGLSDVMQLDDFQKSLKGINDHYRELNTNIRIESKFIEREFKGFWIYQSHNIGSIKEVLDTRSKMTDYYLKNYSTNPNRFEQYQNNQKLDQYKISVNEISKNPAVLRYQMGFYNSSALQESIRLFSDFSKKLNKKIIGVIAERYLSRIKDLNDFYKNQKKLGEVK